MLGAAGRGGLRAGLWQHTARGRTGARASWDSGAHRLIRRGGGWPREAAVPGRRRNGGAAAGDPHAPPTAMGADVSGVGFAFYSQSAAAVAWRRRYVRTLIEEGENQIEIEMGSFVFC